MDFPAVAVIILTGIALLLVTLKLARGGHPENGCGHGDGGLTTLNEQFYLRSDRPAGPDAEDASLEREPAPPGSKTTHRGLRRRMAFFGR